jgi:GNAT superfamily N-acetyltransferase
MAGPAAGRSAASAAAPAPASIAYRRARDEDLDACVQVWRLAVDDYTGRLAQPPLPDDPGPLRRLLAHTMASDPERFWVAVREGEHGIEIAGFSSATVRDGLWFLAMLFVRPGLQAGGVGQALMDRAQAGRDTDPGGPAVPGPDDPLDSGIHTWGMCTDAAQPISNALYARRGMIPRLPVWRLIGEVRRWAAVPPLPATLEALPFDRIDAAVDGPRTLADAVDGIDRELLGVTHPSEHAYLRREGRAGFLVRSKGDGRAVGYVYGSGGGRLGPIAAIDPALHPALIGVAVREVPMLGTVAAWIPGSADAATRALLDAGLRLEGFPALVCWSRRDHPFERYVPGSLALV